MKETKISFGNSGITTGDAEISELQFVCVPSDKYQNVDVCIKVGGWNVSIFSITKSIPFKQREALGYEIEKRWNKERATTPNNKNIETK